MISLSRVSDRTEDTVLHLRCNDYGVSIAPVSAGIYDNFLHCDYGLLCLLVLFTAVYTFPKHVITYSLFDLQLDSTLHESGLLYVRDQR